MHDLAITLHHLDIDFPDCIVFMRSSVLSVGLLLLDRIQLTALGCFSDSLSALGEACRLVIMTPTGQPALTDGGLELSVTSSALWPEGFDCIVVMGSLTGRIWRWSNTVSRYLRTADRIGVTLIGVGTGVDALARLSLLDGFCACAAASDLATLSARHPEVSFVSGQLMVEDGKRITTLDGTVAADLAGLVIDRHLGRQQTSLAMAGIRRSGWRAAETPPPVSLDGYGSTHHKVLRALDLMMSTIAAPLPVEAISDEVGLSRRQFDRLCVAETGQTAKAVYLRIRLEEAVRMLTVGRRSLGDTAWATGFTDASHLSRRLGRRVTDLRAGQSEELAERVHAEATATPQP